MNSIRRSLGLVGAAFAATAILVLMSAAAAPSAATAATTEHAVSRPYTQNWVFRSTKLNRCVFIEASGTLTASWRYAYNDGSTDTLVWSKIKLNNPTISATGWPISGAGCDSTKRWNMKATLEQGWYQAGCDLDVSVSAGFPWSVSATPTYSCGNKRVGHRSSTEGFSTKTLNQYNSGAPIGFANDLASVRGGGIAFKGLVSVRAHTASSSDLVHRTVTVVLNK